MIKELNDLEKQLKYMVPSANAFSSHICVCKNYWLGLVMV